MKRRGFLKLLPALTTLPALLHRPPAPPPPLQDVPSFTSSYGSATAHAGRLPDPWWETHTERAPTQLLVSRRMKDDINRLLDLPSSKEEA